MIEYVQTEGGGVPDFAIYGFRGQFAFLSNFYIEPDNTHVEGEYQAAKCMIALDRNKFVGLTPSQSKRLGRGVRLRADWEDAKIEEMYDLVKRKFLDHQDLAKKLLATGSRMLIESNWWGDTFWGVYRGQGQNILGEILMQVRYDLR